MIKKDKLYTVNKWNRPAFMPNENLFDVGGSFWNGGTSGFIPFDSDAAAKDVELIRGIQFDPNKAANALQQPIQQSLTQKIAMDGYNPGTMKQQIDSLTPPKNRDVRNTENNYAASSPNVGMAIASAAGPLMDSIKTGDPRGAWDTLDPVYHLAGGRESAVGNGLSDAGVALTKSGNPWLMLAGAGLKIVGGLTNAAFGIKENKEMKKAADQSIATNSNFLSNASSFDAIKGPGAMSNTNVYEGGWFSGGKADEKNAELTRKMADAYSWADRSVANNMRNISEDQINNFLRNYSAFGGYLTRPKRRRKIKR